MEEDTEENDTEERIREREKEEKRARKGRAAVGFHYETVRSFLFFCMVNYIILHGQ